MIYRSKVFNVLNTNKQIKFFYDHPHNSKWHWTHGYRQKRTQLAIALGLNHFVFLKDLVSRNAKHWKHHFKYVECRWYPRKWHWNFNRIQKLCVLQSQLYSTSICVIQNFIRTVWGLVSVNRSCENCFFNTGIRCKRREIYILAMRPR